MELKKQRRRLENIGILSNVRPINCLLFLLSIFPRASGKHHFMKRVSDNLVETQSGQIRGNLVTLPPLGGRQVRKVEVYYGLQYASVLDKELRFMPPTSSLEKWDGVKVTISPKPVCPQRMPSEAELASRMPGHRVEHFKRISSHVAQQQEECLILNVFAPLRDENETTQFPVVFFIHGDSYDVGTGNAYDATVMAAFGDVIVITINYRLGILGFLSTGDSNAPGNYALLDLVAGLHWVKENIQAFGGDPNNICLFGHRYGAVLVNLLMVSPLTKGKNLFKNAIMHSGSALSPWALSHFPVHFTHQLLAKINCSSYLKESANSNQRFKIAEFPDQQPSLSDVKFFKTFNEEPHPPFPGSSPDSTFKRGAHESFESVSESSSHLDCLKDMKVVDLVSLSPKPPKYLTSFGPSIDHRSVMPTDLKSMLSKVAESMFAETNLLVGVSNHEGWSFMDQRSLREGITLETFNKMLRTYVQNVFDYHRQSILDVLGHQYNEWDQPQFHSEEFPRPSNIFRDHMVDLLGDAQVVAPVVEIAKWHAKHGSPTYFFVHESSSSSSSSQQYYGSQDFSNDDDLSFIFGSPLVDGGVEPFRPSSHKIADERQALSMLKYWMAFIKTGNPNKQDGVQASSHKSSSSSSSSSSHRRNSNNNNNNNNNNASHVHWPSFDIHRQEYAFFGARTHEHSSYGAPEIRHHYRGSKMALWIDLIPKLHKPDDNLDTRFHQLQNHHNKSTFEDVQLKHDYWSMAKFTWPYTHLHHSNPLHRWQPSKQLADINQTSTVNAVKPKPTESSDFKSYFSKQTIGKLQVSSPPGISRKNFKSFPEGHLPFSTKNQQSVQSKHDISKSMSSVLASDSSANHKDMTHFEDSNDFIANKLPPGGSNSLSLGITVGVGCALFLLNIFIFAILYHQKDRIRREMRRSYALQQHQQQQLYVKDQEMYVANNSDSLRHMNHTFRHQNQDSMTTANLAAKRMSDSHPVFSQKSYSEREQFDSDLEQKHSMVRSSSPLLQLTKPKSDYRHKTVNFCYSPADNSMAAYRSSISDCQKIRSPSPSGSPAGQLVNQTIPKKVLPPPPPPTSSNSFNRVAFAPSVDFFNPGESPLIPDSSWSHQSSKTSSLRPACHRPGTTLYSSGTDQISPVMQETCLDSTSLAAETDELLEALEAETQIESSGGSPSTVV